MTKVLIGVDGSDRSEDAVAFGRALALAAGAPVVLSTAHQTEPRQPRLHARVRDTPGVYAAGDATDFGIKQGGIAWPANGCGRGSDRGGRRRAR
jgi:nucleotide-binding universal stress UspA family protein